MIPILITGPAAEPVSLAEMKAWLRLDGEEEDTLVAALLTAARLTVEAASARFLLTQTWRLVHDAWPAGGIIPLAQGPLVDVVAIRVYAGNGVAQTVPTAALIASRARDPAELRLAGPVPAPGRSREGIEIDLVFGYGASPSDVPAPLRQAVRMLTARWFEHRGDARERDRGLPAEIVALIAPYRRARL